MLCWPYINAHLKKCLKSTENRPPAINKVSYMKVSRLLCILLLIQDGQLLAVGFELAEYFEMVFLEILPSA